MAGDGVDVDATFVACTRLPGRDTVSVFLGETETDVSLDFDLADQLSGAMLPSGSGRLWVTGMYSDATRTFEQVLVSGVAFDWHLP